MMGASLRASILLEGFMENVGQVQTVMGLPAGEIRYTAQGRTAIYHFTEGGMQVIKERCMERGIEEGKPYMPRTCMLSCIELRWRTGGLGSLQALSVVPVQVRMYAGEAFFMPRIYERLLWIGQRYEIHFSLVDGALRAEVRLRDTVEAVLIEVVGASNLQLSSGQLVAQLNGERIPVPLPYVRWEGELYRGRWGVRGNSTLCLEGVGERVEEVSSFRRLARLWATYLGGSGEDGLIAAAVDRGGRLYVAGYTSSADRIAVGPGHQTTWQGGRDGLIACFLPNGQPAWVTYYGGPGDDEVVSCALWNDRYLYVAGGTTSITGMGTRGTHQRSYAGGGDAFLACFTLQGERVWGTYYGGDREDFGYACAVDKRGRVYLAGYTASLSGITSGGSFQPTYGGGYSDGFLAQFDSTGQRVWGTYYGGAEEDGAVFCLTDTAEGIILLGYTYSDDRIATPGAYQSLRGGSQDGFIARFTADGVRMWATYYGGEGHDRMRGGALSAGGYLYLTGFTASSAGIASSNAQFSTYGGGAWDAFLVCFSLDGNKEWGTYYGGRGDDRGISCIIERDSVLWLTGWTDSPDRVATLDGYQSVNGGLRDAYLTAWSLQGQRLWGTYYGGSGRDVGRAIGLTPSGRLYLVGMTESASGIATESAYQDSLGGDTDGFIVRWGCVHADTTYVTVCRAYTWEATGQTYTVSGIYAVNGGFTGECDSLWVLVLTVELPNVEVEVYPGGLQASPSGAMYQWIDCRGVPIAGADSIFFSPAYAGHFAVIVERNGCRDTSECVEWRPTGLGEAQNKKLWETFPNPVQRTLVIQTEQELRLTLWSLHGQKVLSWTAYPPRSEIDIEGIAPGVYILREESTGKLVKIVIESHKTVR